AGGDRGLVADVRELGAREPGRLARDRRERGVGMKRLAARVDGEDRLAAGEIRRRHEKLAVEPARPQEGGIEILDPVRGSHHDDLLGSLAAVELEEELVEGLILLAVEAVPGALRADRVELVDEDDRRRILARLLEELANPRGAKAR